MSNAKHYLVIDLEATCSEGAAIPRREMETIEIGAVLVDAESLETVREFQTFVRPVRHPTLTPFCTELTSISQSLVDAAPFFPEALAAMRAAVVDGFDVVFCSWGDFDRAQLKRDCLYHDVVYPFERPHLDLSPAFQKASRRSRRMGRYGLLGALERAGLSFEGAHHRGIDDARNVVRLMEYCLGRQPLPTPAPTRSPRA